MTFLFPNLSKAENFVLQVILLTLLSCYKLNRCSIKLSLVNILENVFLFIEILFKMLLFKGGVLIYAEHCVYILTVLHPTKSSQNTIFTISN